MSILRLHALHRVDILCVPFEIVVGKLEGRGAQYNCPLERRDVEWVGYTEREELCLLIFKLCCNVFFKLIMFS